MGSADGEGARKQGRERGGAVNEGDRGHPSRRRNLPVPEKCHSLFGYDQFSGTGKFRLWLGCPPSPLFTVPLVRAPRLRAPSPSAFPILSTQTRGSKGELAPPFPGPPHAHTPLREGCPTRVAAPFAPSPFLRHLPASHKWVRRRDSAPAQS